MSPVRHVPGPIPPEGEHGLGEEALHFVRWFGRSKYRLMRGFLGELTRAPEERDLPALRDRYTRALHHAERVQTARTVVTLLLALGAAAATASAVGSAFGLGGILARTAAVSGSLTAVLLIARLLLDRYLERVEVAATFLAIQLAATARRGG